MKLIVSSDDCLKRFPLLCATGVVTLLFALLLAFVTPIFETVDDTCMKAIASGVLICPEPSALLVYSNVAIGWCLKSLYERYPSVQWYAFYELAVQFVSYVTLLWAFLLIAPRRRTIALFSIYLIAMGCHLLVHLSFTTTAFLAIQSGMALLFAQLITGVGSKRAGLGRLFAGGSLIVLGSLVRLQIFNLMALISIPYVISVCMRHQSPRLARQGVITASLVVVAAFGFAAFDRLVLIQTPGWQSFLDLLTQIFRTSDLAKINLLETHAIEAQEILRSVGWSRNDFLVMKSWFLVDEQTFSIDKLQSFGDQWLRLDSSSRVRNVAKLLMALLFILKTNICVSCLLVSFVFSPGGECRISRWGHRLSWGLSWSLMVWLVIAQKLPERVYLPIIAYTAMLSFLLRLFSTAESSCRPSETLMKRHWAGLAIILAFCGASIMNDFVFQARVQRQHRLFSADLNWVASQPNSLFLMMFPFPYECLLPFDDLDELRQVRPVMSGFYIRAPHMTDLSRSYGFTDLLDAIGSETGFRVATDKQGVVMLKQYLREHRQFHLEFKEVYRAKTGFNVYETVPMSAEERPTQHAL